MGHSLDLVRTFTMELEDSGFLDHQLGDGRFLFDARRVDVVLPCSHSSQHHGVDLSKMVFEMTTMPNSPEGM